MSADTRSLTPRRRRIVRADRVGRPTSGFRRPASAWNGIRAPRVALPAESCLSLAVVLPILAAGQAAFVSLLLVSRPGGQRTANRLLAAYFLIYGLAMLRLAAHGSGFLAEHPHLARILVPLELLYGPLVYLYVVVLTGRTLDRRAARHLLPSAFMLILLLPFYASSAEAKLQLIVAPSTSDRQLTLGLWTANWLLLSGYLVAAWRLLHAHRARLRRHLSSLGRAGLDWLRGLLVVLGIAQLVDLAGWLASQGDGASSPWWPVVTAGLVVMLYLFAFQALRQPELRFAPMPAVRFDAATGEWARPAPPTAVPADVVQVPIDLAVDAALEPEGPKYRRSGLSDAQAALLAERVTALLRDDRLYRRSDLALSDLAALADAPPHHVSQVLNERLGGSFFDVVNGYRVAEVQKRLADPARAHLSVLTIAFDAGFNSKTSFNAAFRAATGTTPSAYRKQHLGAPTSVT